MPNNALKKITTRAKQIFKNGGTWKGAIKKASAEYRSGKKSVIGKTKKKRVRKRRAKVGGSKIRRKKIGSIRNNADRVDRKRTQITIGSLMSEARGKIASSIGAKEQRKFTAKGTRAKRKISKEIAALKVKYRKLC
jgi:hypothetical protein